jgi:hypothetical protein
MAVLNENLDWNQITAARPDVRQAFRGVPVKTLVAQGELLCRFITTESKKKGIAGNETFRSPWWMNFSSAIHEIAKWRTTKALPKDVIRARMAVTSDFSQELDSLVQIILTQPVYGWKGIAQHQDDNRRGVTYLGGGEQFYLPNLAADPNGLSSNYAYMHWFGSIEELV